MGSLDAANSLCNTLETAVDNQKKENKKRARKNSINNREFLIAISESDLEKVNSLLKEIDINFKDRDGCSPLHWAVEMCGDVKIIEILLNNGAHLQSENNDHETPIYIAKRMNRLDIVNILETSLHATENAKVTEIRKTLEWNRKRTISQDEVIWINPVHGYIYQLKVLMLFLHRGLSCKYSFRIGTEIKEANKFDDLVFEYVHNNKKVYRLLQAKHKIDESKKITVDKLLTDTKGDYSLVKYFYSFQSCKKDNFFKDGFIKDVIICTNIDFDFNDLKKSGIEIKKVEEKDDILDIRSNEKESTRYKFTNSMVKRLKSKLKTADSVDEIEYFLNHLVFAVNQPNEEELGQIVKREIGREMGFLDTENAYNKLLIKMMDFSLGKRNSMFLSHEEGKTFFDDLKREIPIWFNIQDPVLSFTGRLEYLKRMHEILMKKCPVCITGMGGVGKTELVRKYIVDYGHKYDNQIVWINAECYRTAVDSFRQLASDKLNINLNSSDGKDKHINSIVTAVYQFFSKGKSLFIFDNAENYKCKSESGYGIDQFLPCLPENCIKPNVIITSRNQKWPENIETIVLEAFKADEARELVEKMLTIESHEQKELIVEFVKKLQFLPLALQQAVAYIKMQKERLACIDSNFEISDYLEKYSNMANEFLNFEFSEDSDSTYDKSVFATWNLTFDALKQKENGNDALDILNVISYFLPENIPIDLLLIFSTNKEKLSSAIGLLKQYSIVSVQHKALSVHRLVQQVTRIKLQKQNDEVNILRNAFKLLNEDTVNFKNVDHVISLWTFASKHGELFEEYSRVFNHITSELRDCGRIEEAHSMGLEVSALLKELPLKDYQNQIGLMSVKNNAAMTSLQKGEYKVALEQLQELQELEKELPSELKAKSFSLKCNIAHALSKLGRNQEALKHYYEVLEVNRVDLGESHPDILSVKHDVSAILSEEGKNQEAVSMLREVYQVQKATLGDRHAKTLNTRHSIATILGKLDQVEEALKMLEEVRDDREATLPKDHPEILGTKFNIAVVLSLQQKYDAALTIYRELFDVQKEKLGENHPEVIDINVNVATVLEQQGEHEKALKMFNDAYDKQKSTLGLMHPATLNTQDGIAHVHVSQRKYADAIRLYEDLLDKQKSVLGNDHPNTLETRRSIVQILVKQKNYDAALQRSLKDLKNVERIFGKNQPETLSAKGDLGMVYFYKRDFNEAFSTLMQVLKAQECLFGSDHIDCRMTRNNIALVLKERTKPSRGDASPARSNELLSAVKSGNVVQLEKLLSKKVADIDAKDTEGRTILHHALNAVDERMVELLLRHGAEVFVTSNMGNTPLHIAVLKGRVAIVELLLRRLQADRLNDFVDAKTTSSASTALHVAAKLGHFDIVKCLLKSRATFCVKNKDGKTPVEMASDPKIVKFLKMVEELFEGVKRADVVRRLETLPLEEFLAVASTRDERGSTLSQVAMLNEQKHVAARILQMVQKSKPQ